MIELTSIRAKRVLEPQEAQVVLRRFRNKMATLRIRDEINTDAKEFQVVVADIPARSVIFRDHQYVFVPTVTPKSFEQFTTSCQGKR